MQWAVFEPNDLNLWAKITLNVSAFLTIQWQLGMLFGSTAQEAFYVKCDAETNPPELREIGQVVTEIGVAIVRPAEFVIFRISQWQPAEELTLAQEDRHASVHNSRCLISNKCSPNQRVCCARACRCSWGWSGQSHLQATTQTNQAGETFVCKPLRDLPRRLHRQKNGAI